MGKGRLQYAALPWRAADGGVEILLISSSRGRWIIPKGWPMKDRAPHDAAAQEAWEEAGVRGAVGGEAVGAFEYDKRRKDGRVKRVRVDVFALEVTEEAADWPEAAERERRWLSPAAAAALTDEPELAPLLAAFSPQAPAAAALAGLYLTDYTIPFVTHSPIVVHTWSLAVAGLSYVTVEAWGRRVRQRFDLARRARAGAAPAVGLAS